MELFINNSESSWLLLCDGLMSSWKLLTQKKILLTFLIYSRNSPITFLCISLCLCSLLKYFEEKATSHSISLCCLIRNEHARFFMMENIEERNKTHGSCWEMPAKDTGRANVGGWQHSWLRAGLGLDLYTKSTWLQSNVVYLLLWKHIILGTKVGYWL